MAWWNLTEVVEWRVSLVCNGEIQNDFKMTTKTAYTTLVTSKSYTLVLVYYSHHLR